MNDDLGKRAEKKIREWLDRPESGYSFDRIPDQMTGFYGSCNMCDFTCFKSPNMYYIESKATYKQRFDFSAITEFQYKSLLKKSKILHTYGLVIVLFATERRAFVLDIRDIDDAIASGVKSINIDKIKKWTIPYKEIRTQYSGRKLLLDYIGDIEEYIR